MPLLILQAQVTQGAELSALAIRSKAMWGYSDEFMQQCTPELTYRPEQVSNIEWFFAIAYQVGKQHKNIVGFYALFLADLQQIELDALFVEPALTGQGIGKALFGHAVNYVRQQGAKKLLIQADPNAAPFYQALGAQKIGEQPSTSIPGRMLPLFSYPVA